MPSLNRVILLMLVISLMVFMAACGQVNTEQNSAQGPTSENKPVSLIISAASSLKDAMDEIKTDYTKENPNVTITYNFGSSGSLQQQIEQGADVDVFISAAEKQMDALKEKGLIMEDTRKNFLENEIVLVVPRDLAITDFKDLTTDKVKEVGLGEPKSVPAGQYAEDVLTKLNILDSIKSKIVYGKNVKEVLAWVETGNADAGIVYETDAKVSDKVKLVTKAPKGSHKPIYYPAAVIKASKNTDAAKAFINYLYSSKAKPVFEKYGFIFSEK